MSQKKDLKRHWNKKQRVKEIRLYEESLSQHYATLTTEERRSVRMQLTIRQDGCCAICGQAEKDLKNRLAIDHCHLTGHIRGLLCCRCNWLLGHAKDNVFILQSALNYLGKEAERKFV